MHTKFKIAENVLYQSVADEAVLLNLNDNHYYGLDDVATRMWQLLLEHGEVEAVIQHMQLEYEVDEPTLRSDFNALVEEMVKRGILQPISA